MGRLHFGLELWVLMQCVSWILNCPLDCNCSSHGTNETVCCKSIELQLTAAKLPRKTTHLLLRQTPELPKSQNGVKFLNFSELTQAEVVILGATQATFISYERTYLLTNHSFANNSLITKFASRLPLTMESDALASLQNLDDLTLSTTRHKWADVPAIMTHSLCDKEKLKRLALPRFSKEYISSYQIKFIPKEVFTSCVLPSVQAVDLSDNDIVLLKGGLNVVFPNIRLLDLSHNMLTATSSSADAAFFSEVANLGFWMNLHTLDVGSQMRRRLVQSEWQEKDLFLQEQIPAPTLKCNISNNKRLMFSQIYSGFVWSGDLCMSIERFVIKDCISNKFNFQEAMFPNGSTVAIENNLKYLDTSVNDMRWLYSSKTQLQGFDKLEYLNLQDTRLNTSGIIPPWSLFGDLPRLQYCLLGKNTVGNLASDIVSSFNATRHLKVVDLAENDISILAPDVVAGCSQLTHLNLSGNSILHVDVNLSQSVHLKIFNLSHNRIQNLSQPMRQTLDQLASRQVNPLILDLRNNALSCGCYDMDFITWLQNTKVRISNLNALTCSHPFYGVSLVSSVDPNELHDQCFPSQLKTIAVSVSVTIGVILSFALPLLLYCKRWKMRYWWYVTNSGWRRMRNDLDLESYDYDAFVACHHSDLNWVRHHLLVQMEDLRHFKFCVYHRDFIQGRNTAEEIAEGIHSSKYTILVLSPSFVESEWCHFEMNLAMNQLFDSGRDVILPVILRPLPSKSVNRTLYSILKKKLYMEWDEDDLDAQKLFWCKLNEALSA